VTGDGVTAAPPGSGGADVEPLAGYTIGITAARRREEFGMALQRRGAKVMYGPAIRIVPLADDRQLRAATGRCLSDPLDIVVATTGIGFRSWMEAADAWGLAEKLTEAIGRSTVLARGPKARGCRKRDTGIGPGQPLPAAPAQVSQPGESQADRVAADEGQGRQRRRCRWSGTTAGTPG